MASQPTISQNKPAARTPDVLQWNCRSLKSCAAELGALFRHVGQPVALLLQETRGTNPGVQGYEGHFQPTIVHTQTNKKKQGQQPDEVVEAQAAIFIRRDVPHVKLDTGKYCNRIQEVVAVRCELGGRQTILVSAYLRPESSCYRKGNSETANFAWLRELRHRYPKDRLLAGGDFNARHKSWGYDKESQRGRRLYEEAEAAGLTLANDTDYPTRHALHSRQRDTIPDLTWTTSRLVKDWRCGPDGMGSDHYPIWIELEVRATGRKKRMTAAVDWDRFRSGFDAYDENVPFLQKLSRAAREATREIEVDEHLPTPDKHLLNLWDTRSQLHRVYLDRGKRHVDLVKVRNKTAQARRYAKMLSRERWHNHCASFNERTGGRKLWQTYKAMSGNRKTGNTVKNVRLATGDSASDFEKKAAETLFPQPSVPPDPRIYQRTAPTSDKDVESPFTMQELVMALESVNAKSAPGKDGITWQMLRNLNEHGKMQLLEEINKVWLSGEIPAEWKHSVVSPIPKPGKPAVSISNLRPISLTSTLSKLLERMVLTRLNYHLEEAQKEPYFDPGQTGFRPGLCTQDSIFLLRRCLQKRRGRKRVPGILVAVDLRKAFDTVAHEAVISALEDTKPGARILNIVRSFLEGRTFEIRSDIRNPRIYSSSIGVPQGAILSPTLFNLVMRGLATRLRRIHGVRLTMYADDVTLWTEPGDPLRTTEDAANAIQDALNTLADYLKTTGMEVSPEKTKYILLGGSTVENEKVKLCLAGQTLERAPDRHIKILGISIHESGGAATWLWQLEPKSGVKAAQI